MMCRLAQRLHLQLRRQSFGKGQRSNGIRHCICLPDMAGQPDPGNTISQYPEHAIQQLTDTRTSLAGDGAGNTGDVPHGFNMQIVVSCQMRNLTWDLAQEYPQICILRPRPGSLDPDDFDRIVCLPHTGRIQKRHWQPVQVGTKLHHIARRPGLVGHNRNIPPRHRIHQRRLARVRGTDQRHLKTVPQSLIGRKGRKLI